MEDYATITCCTSVSSTVKHMVLSAGLHATLSPNSVKAHSLQKVSRSSSPLQCLTKKCYILTDYRVNERIHSESLLLVAYRLAEKGSDCPKSTRTHGVELHCNPPRAESTPST